MNNIFVINLKRCILKKEKMEKKLNGIKYTLIEAVDGLELNLEKLKDQNIDILKNFSDPFYGRNITWGEVGCSLSHYKIYKHCVENNINYAIILEDDVIIPDKFDKEINKTITKLKNINWDLCYIGRKKMKKDIKQLDYFVIPNYSYWTCGYIINLKGMKKIIQSNFIKNIMPIDEFISLIGNISPYEQYKKYYNFEEFKIVSVKDLYIKPEPNAFKTSDTENTKIVDIKTDELLILAFDTAKDSGSKRFIESCKVYGLNYKIMALDQKCNDNMALGPVESKSNKINYLINYIKDINDEQIILVSDSYQVIICANSKEIINKFNNFNSPIVFAAEPDCRPNSDLSKEYPSTNSSYKYLNSRSFIGKVKDIKKILQNSFISKDDYQLYYTKQFLSEKGKKIIKLDYECSIFQCLNNGGNDTEILYDKNRLKNKLFDSNPCQIHGNGEESSKLYLNRLENYLMSNWSSCYGYNKKNMLIKLPKKIKLMVYIEDYINIQEIVNFMDLIHKNIKNIEKDCELFVEIYTSNEKIDSSYSIFNVKNSINYYDNKKLVCCLNRKKIIEIAKEKDYDYLWFVNSEYIITNEKLLYNMILNNKGIIGPLLTKKKTLFSNFWGAINNDGWYSRSSDYIQIVTNKHIGCWNICHLFGNYLINKEYINKVQNFYTTFNTEYDIDMNFSLNCRNNDIYMYVENLEDYGYILEEDIEIPDKAINREFYRFFNNKNTWAQKYLHPEFLKAINNWNKLEVIEICKYAFEFPFVSDLFCKHIIEEVNNNNTWSPGGHKSITDKRLEGGKEDVPTVDIHMKQIGFGKQWEEIILEYIKPLVNYLYSPFPTKKIHIAFIVKYEMGHQEFLKPHHDNANYSLVITLNRPNIDFEGGGTRFVKQDVVSQGKMGYCCIHPGRITHYHEGLPITKGERYIMVSFVM